MLALQNKGNYKLATGLEISPEVYIYQAWNFRFNPQHQSTYPKETLVFPNITDFSQLGIIHTYLYVYLSIFLIVLAIYINTIFGIYEM